MTPAEVAALIARLNAVIADAQALQIDIQRQTIERRTVERAIAQANGPRATPDRS